MERLSIPPENSLISTGFGRTDYCDSYRIVKPTNDTPEQIAVQLFTLPAWVGGLLNIRNWAVRPFGLKTDKNIKRTDTLFPVIAQNENEILMEIMDKHLNFRVSVLIDREKSYICITTIVHYNNCFGKIYFLFVKPFHKVIVRSIIKKQLK
jgi:hypothetical protein